MAITKSADPLTVTAGSILTYTVVIKNNGPSDAISIRLVDNLPTEVTLLGDVGIVRSGYISVPVSCLGAVCETSLMQYSKVDHLYTAHSRWNPADSEPACLHQYGDCL